MSADESLMILRHWREIAKSRKQKDKMLRKHVKSRYPKRKIPSPKKKDGFSLSSEISKDEFVELFEFISQTEQVRCVIYD